MATNTKIIRFNNGSTTYVPVTIANAVQYSYTGGVMSVQDAIQTVAGVATEINHSVENNFQTINSHVSSNTQLTYTAGSGIGLTGAHHDNTKIKVEGGTYIKIEAVNTNEGIKISSYGLSASTHNHNIGFTGDITLSSTQLSTSLQPTVNKSTNIKGGAAKKIAYQTAANTTGFINAPTTSGQVLKYDGSKIDWGTDNDTKLTEATITVSEQLITNTTYSVNVLQGSNITMTGTSGTSVSYAAKYYKLPTQYAIDKAAAETLTAAQTYASGLVISAMNYRGVTTTQLYDGASGASYNPITINGESVTVKQGDIVMSGQGANEKEFIWSGTTWNELGDVSAKANKTIRVDGEGELGGGGTLTSNITITHDMHQVGEVTAPNQDITGTTGIQKVITGLTINDYGHITGYTAATIYSQNTNSFDFSKITAGTDVTNVNGGTVTKGDSNAISADIVGDTLTVVGGNKWITTGTNKETDTLYINHAIPSTSPAQQTPGLYTIAIDEAGHITSSSSVSIKKGLKFDTYDSPVEFSLALGTAESTNNTILTDINN